MKGLKGAPGAATPGAEGGTSVLAQSGVSQSQRRESNPGPIVTESKVQLIARRLLEDFLATLGREAEYLAERDYRRDRNGLEARINLMVIIALLLDSDQVIPEIGKRIKL